MALQVWLPLNGNLDNFGLSNLKFSLVSSNTTANANGKIGSCYANNSNTAGGLISNSTIDLGQKQSMFCWVKFTSLMANASLGGALITQHRYSNYTGMGLTIKHISSTTGYLSVNTGNGSARTYNTYCATTLMQANTWYHVGYTYDGAYIRLYVNGVLENTVSYTGMSVPADYIGVFAWSMSGTSGSTIHNNYLLNGSLNDVRIYDHCLSRQEVKEVAQSLILHYKLDSIQNNILPPGIELYDTLQADGSSWINTQIPYDSTKTTYVVKCKFSQPSNTGQYDAVFGAYTGESYKCFRIIRGNDNSIMWSYYNSQAGGGSGNRIQFSTANTNVREVVMTVNGVTLTENGTTTSYNYGTRTGTDTTSTFYLFSQNGTGSCRSRTVLYYWTIYDGDRMLGNFLPATFYGEPGMYDTVTKKFFKNDTVGTFTVGTRHNIVEYDYLQCDTASYINTGVIPTTQTGFELKYSANSIASENVFFGCSTASGYANGNNYSLDILTSGRVLYTFKTNGYDSTDLFITADTQFVTRLFGSTFCANTFSYSANRNTSHPNLSIFLFGRNVNGTVGSIRAGKIYYCKFWEGDNLIKDFIPVSYNGTLGLFDKVELKFYPNAGTGTFTAGTVITNKMLDCSGHRNDGDISGSLVTTANSPRYLRCSSFASSPYIIVGRGPMVKDEITVALWANISNWAATNYRTISCTETGGWNFETNSSGKIQFPVGTGTTGNTYKTAVCPVSISSGWHHIAGTYDGYAVSLYVDGVVLSVITAYTTKTPIFYHSSNGIFIGREAGSSPTVPASNYQYTGDMSDVRIYATALSPEDIADLYHTSAIVDNLGNFHTFEAKEEEDVFPEILKVGDAIANNFLEIGNRIKTLSDGSVWLHVLHHGNPASNLFTAANCWNYDNGSTLYSALWLLKNEEWKYNGKYELLVCEKLTSSSSEAQYRWTQTSNPSTSSSITGFTVISGSGTYFNRGLLTNGNYGAMHNGNTWWCCCGSYTAYQGGIPGMNGVVTTGSLDLYIRITQDIFKNPENGLFSIYETGYVQNELIEI